jgi:hypothetical protein
MQAFILIAVGAGITKLSDALCVEVLADQALSALVL